MHILDFQHIGICQYRMNDLQYMTVLRLLYQKVSVFTDIYTGRSNNFFTDRINWRVCNLCKKLFEIIKQRAVLIRQYGKWCIHTHCTDTLSSVQCHVADRCTILFIRIAECFLQTCTLFICIFFHTDVRDLDIFKLYQIAVQPLTIRLHGCIFFFQFIIINNFSLNGIHKQHFARMQTLF